MIGIDEMQEKIGKLLGTVPDTSLAAEYGYKLSEIRKLRKHLGIRCKLGRRVGGKNKSHKDYSPIIAYVQEHSDADAARYFNMTRERIIQIRDMNGIPLYRKGVTSETT